MLYHRLPLRYFIITLLLTLIFAPTTEAKSPETTTSNINYLGLTFSVEKLGSIPIWIHLPKKTTDKTASYPLIVFLHGAGERGTDGLKQLTHGAPFLAEAATKFNCFIMAPQCPLEKIWAGRHWKEKKTTLTEKPSNQMLLVMKAIDKLCEKYPIDRDRIYIVGLSMGGFGTWEAIQRWPERFAAAVPICGGGDHTFVTQLKNYPLPIWVFHGAKDKVVPVQKSHKMIDAFKKSGANIKYTEYPDVGHNSWENAFADPHLLPWLISHRRPKK